MATGVHFSFLEVCDGQGGLLNSLTTQVVVAEVPLAVAKLLDEFVDLFQEPSELFPSRLGYDHQIPLVQVCYWTLTIDTLDISSSVNLE